MKKNSLIGKIRLISKLMTSQPGKRTLAIYILPMKFDLLIDYNMRNIYLEKLYT